jgi:hypothetical protein
MLINKIDTVMFQIKFSGQQIRVWSDHMSIRICSGPYAYGPNQARIQDFMLGGALLRAPPKKRIDVTGLTIA